MASAIAVFLLIAGAHFSTCGRVPVDPVGSLGSQSYSSDHYGGQVLGNAQDLGVDGQPKDFFAPPKYDFRYGVDDATTGDRKAHWEKRAGDAVSGGYSLLEADGSTRTVTYTADGKTGFHAVVTKSGEGQSGHPTSQDAQGSYNEESQYQSVNGYHSPIKRSQVSPVQLKSSNGPVHISLNRQSAAAVEEFQPKIRYIAMAAASNSAASSVPVAAIGQFHSLIPKPFGQSPVLGESGVPPLAVVDPTPAAAAADDSDDVVYGTWAQRPRRPNLRFLVDERREDSKK